MGDIIIILLLLGIGLVTIIVSIIIICKFSELRRQQDNLAQQIYELRQDLRQDRLRYHASQLAKDTAAPSAKKLIPSPVAASASPVAPNASPVAANASPVAASAQRPMRSAISDPLSASTPAPQTPLRVQAPVKAQTAQVVAGTPDSSFERRSLAMLARIWSWIVVGDEHRPQGVSFEFAFATTWLLRLGVLALVLGIGFFLRLSITRGWLNEEARVLLCGTAGVGLLIGGQRLLGKAYHILGQGAIGTGLATLYFSVYATVTLYHLVGPVTGFVLMSLVTLTAGLLALRHQALLIAILGLIGGYGTPIILSTGVKNLPGLYAYMFILGIGVLAVARLRYWPLLVWLAMLMNWLVSGLALSHHYLPTADFAVCTVANSAFFILFSTSVFLYQWHRREPISGLELGGLSLNAILFFIVMYALTMQAYGRAGLAVVCLCLAAYYAAHSGLLLKLRHQDRGLLLSCTGLAAVALGLSLPMALHGDWLSPAWALHALMLLFLADKLASQLMRGLSLALFTLVISRLLCIDLPRSFDLAPSVASLGEYLPLLATRLVCFGIPLLCLGAAAWMCLRRPDTELEEESTPEETTEASPLLSFFSIATALMGFIYLNAEIHWSCVRLCPPLRLPLLSLVWTAAAIGLLLLARRRDSVALGVLAILMAVVTGLKFLVLDLPSWDANLLRCTYNSSYSASLAFLRCFDFALLLALGLAFRRWSSLRTVGTVAMGSIIALALLFLTLEGGAFFHYFIPGLAGGGVSLLWAIFAFALLAAGIQKALRSLRYVALTLFAVTVAKIFLADLARLDSVWRIGAFMGLGLILIAGSYIYLRSRQNTTDAKP